MTVVAFCLQLELHLYLLLHLNQTLRVALLYEVVRVLVLLLVLVLIFVEIVLMKPIFVVTQVLVAELLSSCAVLDEIIIALVEWHLNDILLIVLLVRGTT